jgi:hypothetical protein
MKIKLNRPKPKPPEHNYPVWAIDEKTGDLLVFDNSTSCTVIHKKAQSGTLRSYRNEDINTIQGITVLKPGESITITQE